LQAIREVLKLGKRIYMPKQLKAPEIASNRHFLYGFHNSLIAFSRSEIKAQFLFSRRIASNSLRSFMEPRFMKIAEIHSSTKECAIDLQQLSDKLVESFSDDMDKDVHYPLSWALRIRCIAFEISELDELIQREIVTQKDAVSL